MHAERKTRLASPLRTLGLNLQTGLVDEVKRLGSVASVNDARDVDLVRALRYHLDVDVALRERGEESTSDAHEIAHLLAY